MGLRPGALVFIACLCIDFEAQAEIVYGDGRSNAVYNYFFVQSFDLNKDGRFDFHFEEYAIGTTDEPPSSVTRFFSLRGPVGGGNHNNGVLTNAGSASPLPRGMVIGANESEPFGWIDGFRELNLSSKRSGEDRWRGTWGEQGTGLLGVRFLADDDHHYGWIRLNVEDVLPGNIDGDAQRIITPHVVDFAYEATPNTPIIAGAVPEPATWLLVFAAAAMAAGWKLRRGLLPFLICILVPVVANGEIVHRAAVRPGISEPLDLDGNGLIDFRFDMKWFSPDPDHLGVYFAIEQVGGARHGVLTDGDIVPALSPGFVVGPSSQGLNWDDEFVDREIPDVSPIGSLLGHPPAPTTQFVGIRLQADDGWHYGWVRLAQGYWAPFDMDHPNWPDDTDSVPYFALPRIDTYNPGVIDWAYESAPNTPIVAGAVPEPGPIALLVVALCVLCVLTPHRFDLRSRASASRED
jgi:hypothetical protein